MASARGSVARWGSIPTDVVSLPVPYTHIGGIAITCAVLHRGCRIVFIEMFDPVNSPLDLAEHGATKLGSAVPFFHAYRDAQLRHGSEPLFPRLRAFSSGGAPQAAGALLRAEGALRCPDPVLLGAHRISHHHLLGARRQRRGPVADRGPGGARVWSCGWSSPDGGRSAPRARGRAARPGSAVDRRLRRQPARRRRLRRPGFLPHRRPRCGRPARPRPHHRPVEGRHHPQRREHLGPGDRRRALHPPEDRRRRRHRGARPDGPASGRAPSSCWPRASSR